MSNTSLVNAKLIPRKVLFGNADKKSVGLSYDGKYISYVAPKDGVQNIWIVPANDLSNPTPITADTGRGIIQYSWAYDNEHMLFLQDYNGDENNRIYNYNINTKATTLLTPERGVKASIICIRQDFAHEVLVGLNERDKKYVDVYKYNLITGDKECIFQNDKYINFVFDRARNLRIGQFMNQSGEVEYHEYKDKKFSLLLTVPFEDTQTTRIIGFDNTGDMLYLLDSIGRNTGALKSWNLKTGEKIIMAEDEKSDIDILTTHPTTRTIQAVKIDYKKKCYEALEPSIKEDLEYLRELCPGNIIIGTRTTDDKAWIIGYVNDSCPIKYYKYNREEKNAEFLFTSNNELKNYKLAQMHPVVIKSRDGLDLVSYITYPDDIIPVEPIPMVLSVHGGPYGIRDSWGFDYIHQLLANRGYAVMSINYRGSGGFGKDFINLGAKQWGLKMHDDLIDGVNWSIEHKIANPQKIAIMGGSYGGYATLVGLTFTPDVFACGVDLVGPSNIVSLIENRPIQWGLTLNNSKRRMGDIEKLEDVEAMKKVSPLFYVDKITKPLFIVQGGNDQRVKQMESDQMVSAMKSHNIPVIYGLYPDEGHGLARPENRISYYAMVEKFFQNILGGRAEDIGDDLNGANFTLNGDTVKNDADAVKIIEDTIRDVSFIGASSAEE